MLTDKLNRTPYWLDHQVDPVPFAIELPAKADVVVVGSGYTGIHTALQTARSGRSTVVLDSGLPGQGCSTRNGGQISTSVKPSLGKLAKVVGLERARTIRQEGERALEWIEDFLQEESIACDFTRCGRFHAAHTPAHYEAIARDIELLKRNEGIEAFAVAREDQHSELGTDVYYGGVVFPRHASLDPGKYHYQLLKAAIAAGVEIVPHCAALKIVSVASNGENQIDVQTSKGEIKTRDVMIATNGYTNELTPWLQRRVIPIGSYVIATEPLPEEQIDELFPNHRVTSDTRRVVYYFRASPDRSRVIFGGRVSANETDPAVSGPRLHTEMSRIFPQLRQAKISHSWAGTVAYTFDSLAHTGKHNGVFYAMGYCGSGVSMASYLGMRAGQKIIGSIEGKTAFDDLPFPTRPLYRGNPWFLPPVVSWYRWRDKIEYTRASA